MAYGVATTNLFALLDDENEDPQVLAATKAKVAPKKDAPKEEAKPAASKPSGNQGGRGEGGRGRGEARNDGPGEGRGRGRGRGDYGGRGEGRGRGRGRGDYYSDRPRFQDRSGDGQAGDNEGGFQSGGGFESGGDGAPRGRGGYRGRGRGGRGGRRGDGDYYNRGEGGEDRGYGREDFGGDRRPRRQFERHDGTGRGHEGAKRAGAGKGNWGSDADAVLNAAATEPTVEDKTEEITPAEDAGFGGGFGSGPAEGAEAPKAEGFGGGFESAPAAEGAAAEEETPAEEEVQEMTLDEYEKILAEKKAQLNKQTGANEVDLSQFKGMAAYKRKDDNEDTLGLELKNKKEAKQAKEKARKEVVTIETGFKIQSAEELGGGRGRGRGRGGRGRGDRPEGTSPTGDRPSGDRPDRGPAGRGGFRPPPSEERGGFPIRGRGRGRGTGPAPPIDDEAAFPSLG